VIGARCSVQLPLVIVDGFFKLKFSSAKGHNGPCIVGYEREEHRSVLLILAADHICLKCTTFVRKHTEIH